jgi:hypothetical protein
MKTKRIIASVEMILLVSMSFAIAGLMSGSFGVVSAQGGESEYFAAQRAVADTGARAAAPTAPAVTPAASSAAPVGLPNSAAAASAVHPAWSSGVVSVSGKSVPGFISPDGGTAYVNGQFGAINPATKAFEPWPAGTTPGAVTPEPTILSQIFGGQAFGGGFAGALTSGLIWGAIVYGASYFIAKMFGLNKSQAQSIAMGLGAGTALGTTLYFTGTNAALQGGAAIPYLTTPMAGLFWGGALAAVIIIATYKKEKQELVTFTCEPWQAPTGGNRCDECNKDPLIPCSEYRCKSLGQACDIVNKGEGNELCVWKNKNDVTAPVITTWEEALKPTGLKYLAQGNGYKIIDTTDSKGCLQPFTKIEFGVKTDEPAQCRVSFAMNENFSDMAFLFGEDNRYGFEHAQTNFRTPNANVSEESGDAPAIHNDGLYTLYLRCRDANGNGEDMAPFTIRFCIGQGPDTKPPVIEGFSIPDGSAVQYEVDHVPIEVYTNEPAECKWSKMDKTFETMENPMTCSRSTTQFNADLNYVCSASLTEISDRANNKFYFRCKDRPTAPENERNVMLESKSLTLRGTQPLVVTGVGPTGEIRGATSQITVNLTVKTAFGADDGKVTCYYEPSPDGAFNVAMLGEGTASQNQPIPLAGGSYTYYFHCIDSGGNLAVNSTSFTVSVDTTPPVVLRAFKDGANLKIIANEEAKCVYSLNKCEYEFTTGIPFIYDDPSVGKRNVMHVEWSTDKTYYVKCEDYQGKRVDPNACTIVVRGSEL